jgi:death-on-curing family protein
MADITLPEVEFIAFELARKTLAHDEPIPDFSTRFPSVLESCLLTPFQSYSGKDAYAGLIPKAAILFYLMIKNHPFQNGNKRVAVTTTLIFLLKNGRWLSVDQREFYNFAVWVAGSPPRLKKSVVDGIEKFFSDHIVRSVESDAA